MQRRKKTGKSEKQVRKRDQCSSFRRYEAEGTDRKKITEKTQKENMIKKLHIKMRIKRKRYDSDLFKVILRLRIEGDH